MLPESGGLLKKDFKEFKQPSKTFRLDPLNQRIVGSLDGLESVRQAVNCALNTERFDWLIYSWNYGVELKDLFGRPMGLVKSKLKKRIKEALTQDDRIQSVDAFSFDVTGRKLHVKFTVHSTVGDIQAEKEVKV